MNCPPRAPPNGTAKLFATISCAVLILSAPTSPCLSLSPLGQASNPPSVCQAELGRGWADGVGVCMIKGCVAEPELVEGPAFWKVLAEFGYAADSEGKEGTFSCRL